MERVSYFVNVPVVLYEDLVNAAIVALKPLFDLRQPAADREQGCEQRSKNDRERNGDCQQHLYTHCTKPLRYLTGSETNAPDRTGFRRP